MKVLAARCGWSRIGYAWPMVMARRKRTRTKNDRQKSEYYTVGELFLAALGAALVIMMVVIVVSSWLGE